MKYIKSLKFRILIIILLVGIIPATFIHLYYTIEYKDDLIQKRIESIKKVSNITRNTIMQADYLNTHSSLTVDTELAQIATVFDGRTMVIDKNFQIIKDTYSVDEGHTCVTESVIKCFRGENVINYSEEKSYIEIALSLSSTVADNSYSSVDGVILLTFSLDDINKNVSEVIYKGDIILLIIWIIVACVAFVVHLLISTPFMDMKKSIDEVKMGQFDRKIDWNGYTELKEIGYSIGKMMNRMKELDESRQEFVSNVSHELKTPITSIKVLSESLITQDNVPPEMYKEFMTDIVAEMDRESSIINDLLTLVKLEKKTESLNIKKIYINDMVELVLKRLRPIAAQKNIELVLETFRPIEAEVDEVKMTMVVTNLVENAIKYNVVDGWVRVSLNADYKFFYIKVSDSGIGIPKESQDKIFERFYRVDKARSRETGGTGLGLSIAYNTVLAHKGDIKVHSKENEGTTFIVRIPLVYVS